MRSRGDRDLDETGPHQQRERERDRVQQGKRDKERGGDRVQQGRRQREIRGDRVQQRKRESGRQSETGEALVFKESKRGELSDRALIWSLGKGTTHTQKTHLHHKHLHTHTHTQLECYSGSSPGSRSTSHHQNSSHTGTNVESQQIEEGENC